MFRLIPVFARLSSREIGARVEHAKVAASVYAFVALMGLTAYACLVAAVVVLVARAFGPVAGAAVVAAAAVLAALGALVYLASINRRRSRERAKEEAARNAAIMTAAVPLLPVLLRSKLFIAAAAVGGMGFLASKRLGRRDDDDVI